MKNDMTQPDAHGRQWVYVGTDEALAHPMGQAGGVIWLCSAWLMVNAGFAVLVMLGDGVIGLDILWPLVFTAAGAGLIFRKYWAWWLSLLGCARVLWMFTIMGGAKLDGTGGLIFLGNAVVAVGVGFYLIEGARPNLIYRHRYRSHRAEAGAEAGDNP